jgi:hypothetical protein
MTIIHWEFDVNTLRTWWEHFEDIKKSKPPPPPKPIFVYTNTPSMTSVGTHLLILLINIFVVDFFVLFW